MCRTTFVFVENAFFNVFYVHKKNMMIKENVDTQKVTVYNLKFIRINKECVEAFITRKATFI